MTQKELMKQAQENANKLFKFYLGQKNAEAAAYYKGIWDALVWAQYDIQGELFEEEQLAFISILDWKNNN